MPSTTHVRWAVLVIVAFAWVASLWLVGLLQFLDMFGDDDQAWLPALFGNVLYAVVVTIVPVAVGWAAYVAALPLLWRRTLAAPALLAPVLFASVFACFAAAGTPEWWPLAAGYGVLAALLVHAVGYPRKWNDATPGRPWR